MKASDFVGLSKTNAEDLADRMSLIYRLISIDGSEYFSYPTDKRDDRVCIEIEKGKVVKASIQ
jgi:hypothetical protein